MESADIAQIWLEKRTESLNRRDMLAVRAFRASRVIGHEIRIDHAYPMGPHGEPLLWILDIIAGAINAAEVGELAYRDPLEPFITEHRIQL